MEVSDVSRHSPDPTFVLGTKFHDVDQSLPDLKDVELRALVGAVVAEFVNRGNDTETALNWVLEAARGGAEGSQDFDRSDA